MNSTVPDEGVHISDYRYISRHRKSLRDSRIGQIMEGWWEAHKAETLSLLEKFCSFREYYEKIPIRSIQGGAPVWYNAFLPPFDAISIYAMLTVRNPRYYVEVGSGNTTLFAAQAIRDQGLRTKIISVDPYPRADIDALCEKIYRVPLEDMDTGFFETFSGEDILLIDNSHRSFPNSDVTVFFTEMLPALPAGLAYTLHDIYLPSDYPEEMSNPDRVYNRWYNEQYLFCAYLLGGAAGDKMLCPNFFLSGKEEVIAAFHPLCGKGSLLEALPFTGGFLWMEKA
jgi:hypothetical protein